MVDRPTEASAAAKPMRAQRHIAQLVDDVRTIADAEIAYYRSRLSYSAGVAKSVSIFVGLALLCVLGGFSAFVLGLLLSLAQSVGYVGATAIVSIGFIAVAALFAILARNNARKLSFPEIDGQGNR